MYNLTVMETDRVNAAIEESKVEFEYGECSSTYQTLQFETAFHYNAMVQHLFHEVGPTAFPDSEIPGLMTGASHG